jgi:hypothetical protein
VTPTGNDLTEQEVADLLDAIDDEYKARATYRQVIADFGEVRPFVNIVDAEQRHIDALVVLFERYGLAVPDDPWPGQVPRYESLAEACRAGVEAEVDNAALYDRVLQGTHRDDVLEVYRNLQRASQENHLPAFQRCAEGRGAAGGPGGRSRGPGGGGRGGGGRGRGAGGRGHGPGGPGNAGRS